MKTMFTLLGALAVGSPAAAFAQDAAVEAPIHQFVDGFNKGDIAAAAATVAPSLSIVDEVAPFLWSGTEAFRNWGESYDKDAKTPGIANAIVTIGKPTRELIADGHAYVIVPATYSFTQKGVKMIEQAQMTITLEKGAAGWKITGWAWTGPNPSPAK